MAQYDVRHIDIGRYRELRRLVQDGRARAVIIVDYPDAEPPPLLQSVVFVDAGQLGRRLDRICQNSKNSGVGGTT